MTRAELISELAASNPHLRQAGAELIVATIFDQITAALARGERVELRGFGAFTVKQRNAHIGRAPARWWQWGRRRGRSSRPAKNCATGSIAAATPRQRTRRNRGGLGIRFWRRSKHGQCQGHLGHALHTNRIDPTWMLKRIVDQNPLVWMAEVNGLLVDDAKCHVRCR